MHPLTKQQIYDIHMAVLEVLERVGVRAETERMLRIFADGGADVDFDQKLVRIPQHLVSEALAKAPKKVVLCGRNPRYDIILENNRVHFGIGGSPKSRILDIETKKLRLPTKKDVEDSTKLADALHSISFIQNIANSSNMPHHVQYIHNTEAMLNNTEKHLVCTAANAAEARIIMRMGSIVENDLRSRPILSVYSCPAAPLLLTSSQENVIEAAESGIPAVLCGGPMAGATAPVTLAGQVVQNIAENLSVLVLCQLVNPGTPVVIGATTGLLDQRTTMFCLGAPEQVISQVMSVQVSHYYGLPYFGTGGCSDSNTLDAQAAAEATMTALTCALCGMDMIQDVAVISHDDVGSMELAVIADDIIGIIERILQWATIDDESLAVDVIAKVGPAGQFLSQKHTRLFLKREFYFPKLFNRQSETAWVKAGSKDLLKVAAEKVKEILREHHPEPLPEGVKQKLAETVKKAEKDLIRT